MSRIRPLSIEQLELGLQVLDHADTDLNLFWDRNIDAFTKTVLLAIHETSDALLSPTTPLRWRAELENDLKDLLQCFDLADRYRGRRLLSPERSAAELPPLGSRVH
jgi:hypothetical protein